MASPKVPTLLNCGKTMISRSFSSILRNFQSTLITKFRGFSTASPELEQERDPAPFFFNKEVQELLKSMTGRDYQKIFRRRKDSRRLTTPEYKFMTDQQLKESMLEADHQANRLLQMPPVLKKRSDITTVLSRDPALQGYETSKFVFTDITFGVEDRDRLIAVREPDGTLRHANWDERHRMNQIYFPVEGRNMTMPQMFEKEHLEEVLKRKDYLFILDRACIQMDPDDPKYLEVTQTVYNCIDKDGNWDILKSTRHFGPMVFHLAWNKNISNLFLHNIKSENLKDNVALIHLYQKLHPDNKYNSLNYQHDDVKFVEDFINIEFPKSKILPALQAYKELVEEKKKIEKNIKKAHGLDDENVIL